MERKTKSAHYTHIRLLIHMYKTYQKYSKNTQMCPNR